MLDWLDELHRAEMERSKCHKCVLHLFVRVIIHVLSLQELTLAVTAMAGVVATTMAIVVANDTTILIG